METMTKNRREEKKKELWKIIREAMIQLNTEAYVIGGFVRDRLLGRSTKDIDIVCQDDGVALAQEFSRLTGLESGLKQYSRYGVAMIRYEDYEIEFVGARKESYSRDSRKPEVEKGTLEDDQLRREDRKSVV